LKRFATAKLEEALFRILLNCLQRSPVYKSVMM